MAFSRAEPGQDREHPLGECGGLQAGGGRSWEEGPEDGTPLEEHQGECWQQLGGKGWGRGDPVEQICVLWKGDGKKSPFLVTVLVMFTEAAVVIVPQGIQLLIRKMNKIRRWMVVTAGTTHECTQSH